MSVEDKVRNLGNLISSQVGVSGTAIMDDLEAAILNRQGTIPPVQQQVLTLTTLPNEPVNWSMMYQSLSLNFKENQQQQSP